MKKTIMIICATDCIGLGTSKVLASENHNLKKSMGIVSAIEAVIS
ncbi:hypothetical protein [Brumicola nitratireducens]|uniref:Uncharacterized protein n=1 Tax=Glaciecola nitratireducens (strain JCM 12485 / KCTC 12276 / FR1064) TaxID=1085623 RepID=G4QL20_GLANF|nr:hypothetical protein [Glaciecola nitratireducens]AEP29410.1 hypothetical protein GNIT_1286 [Glaciecola nitratireducens FR1064]